LCAGDIVSQASLTEMSTMHDEYGFGLYPVLPSVIGHTGSNVGYVSWAGCQPAYGTVVVVLTNRMVDDIGGLATPLLDALRLE